MTSTFLCIFSSYGRKINKNKATLFPLQPAFILSFVQVEFLKLKFYMIPLPVYPQVFHFSPHLTADSPVLNLEKSHLHVEIIWLAFNTIYDLKIEDKLVTQIRGDQYT